MEFKDRLKQYRQENNLTQDELAEKLFVSRQAISKYETGRGYPAIDVMMQLSKLMGISLDELISKEELAKQTINTGQEVRKNKRNFIIAIGLIIALLIVCVVAVVLSYKSLQQTQQPAQKCEYDLVGIVGTTDSATPDIAQLANNKLFGYCYMYNETDDIMSGSSYNICDMSMQITEQSGYYDMSLLISARQKSVNMYEVYYNPADDEYKFNLSYVMDLTVADRFEIELDRDGYMWKFVFRFTTVDTLSDIKIYEYGLDGTCLKSTDYRGESYYTILPECLYLVIEEKLKDANGYEYYNRTVIYNSQINKHYIYPLKILNENGFGNEILIINKY